MPPKVREIKHMLHKDGWYVKAQTGSHIKYGHPVKIGCVTVSGKDASTIPVRTWHSIQKQAGWR